MKAYSKKAIKSGVYSAMGFGLATGGIDFYNNDDLEIWKILLRTLLFGIIMGIYFNYKYKAQSKES